MSHFGGLGYSTETFQGVVIGYRDVLFQRVWNGVIRSSDQPSIYIGVGDV